MIEAKVGDKEIYRIKYQAEGVEVNDKLLHPDIITLEDGSLHILLGNKSYRVRPVSFNKENKTCRILVNNHEYEVALKNETDLLLESLGLSAALGNKLNELKAPMPGMVLKILVEPGQEVKKGDSLLVLEAMKMENNIKAAGEGKVKSIKVKPQTKVEKNTILIEFE